jgi:cell pole-organizing protein PopZ
MANLKREEEGEMSIEEILASIRRYVGDDSQNQSDPSFLTPKPSQSYTPSSNEAHKTAEALAASLSAMNTESSYDNQRSASQNYYASQNSTPYSQSGASSENVIRLTDAYAVKTEPQGSSVSTPEANAVLSPQAQSATTQSFARLAEAAMRQAPRSSKNDQTSLTLEQLIGEIAQPIIKQWLDQNLPRLVELTVTKEIERLAKQFVRDV